ncbi:MAG: hypothetical protein ACRC0X_01305 [Brevinema sp.]
MGCNAQNRIYHDLIKRIDDGLYLSIDECQILEYRDSLLRLSTIKNPDRIINTLSIDKDSVRKEVYEEMVVFTFNTLEGNSLIFEDDRSLLGKRLRVIIFIDEEDFIFTHLEQTS